MCPFAGQAQVDAHSILLTFCAFIYVSFPFGVSTAATIRVGNLVGANRPSEARLAGMTFHMIFHTQQHKTLKRVAVLPPSCSQMHAYTFEGNACLLVQCLLLHLGQQTSATIPCIPSWTKQISRCKNNVHLGGTELLFLVYPRI